MVRNIIGKLLACAITLQGGCLTACSGGACRIKGCVPAPRHRGTAGAMRRERGPQASGRTRVPGVAVAATMGSWRPIITGHSEVSKSFRNLLTAGAGRLTLGPSNWGMHRPYVVGGLNEEAIVDN